MFVEKLGDHIGSESEGHAPVILAPALYALLWVRPQQVAQESGVRHLARPMHLPNLVEILQVWGQP